MINAVRRWKFYEPNKNFGFSYFLKPGAGVVIPRTDVTLFLERLNNNWHLQVGSVEWKAVCVWSFSKIVF